MATAEKAAKANASIVTFLNRWKPAFMRAALFHSAVIPKKSCESQGDGVGAAFPHRKRGEGGVAQVGRFETAEGGYVFMAGLSVGSGDGVFMLHYPVRRFGSKTISDLKVFVRATRHERPGQPEVSMSKPVLTGDRFYTILVSMNDRIRESIRQKLGDAIELPFPQFTPREAETTVLEGKARAVIGMRRAGKATFLYPLQFP